MKKMLCLALCVLMCLNAGAAFAQEYQLQGFNPELLQDSTVFSMPLALSALEMASMYSAEMAQQYFLAQGFEILRQENYDKDPADYSHTSAYTIAQKAVTVGGEERTLLCLTVRGTSAGEWISNFDVSPSHSDVIPVAENFYFAAEQIFQALREEMAKTENPLVLVCGHSRGAACANLIGVLLDTVYAPENVYVYTFATPATVRGEWKEAPYNNIFNLINPGDWVTSVPLASWGFERAGTDIILPADKAWQMQADAMLEVLNEMADSVSSYYEDVHNLMAPGLAEEGMTAFEFMSMVAQALFIGTPSAEFETWQSMSGMVENDFSPMMALMSQMSGDTEMGKRISSEHMPTTYGLLMQKMAMEQAGAGDLDLAAALQNAADGEGLSVEISPELIEKYLQEN